MPRFTLTISDLDERQLAALAAACADLPDDADDGDDTGEDSPTTDAAADAPATKKWRGRKVKAAKPATLPANTAPAAPVPAAPAPAAPAAPAAPEPVPAAPEPVPAAPAATGGPTTETLIAKARTLGTGPLGQTALLAVLNAMAVNSLPKVPDAQYPALDALLDAAIAYSGTPAPTKEWLKHVCQTGQYEAATTTLIEAVNSATGL